MYIIKQNKNKQWIIIKKGASRATRIFSTKIEAEMYAKNKYPGNYEVEETIRPANSTAKAQKKVQNNIKKAAKKNPKPFIIAFIIIILLLAIGIGVLWYTGKLDPIINKYLNGDNTTEENGNNNQSNAVVGEGIIYDDFQIHFLELGNEYAGDSVYIKSGDVDILIDAGSRKDSATTIKNYINTYCTDGKLEYVISTHAHQDHIAGMIGSGKSGIYYSYNIDYIIDFATTESSTTTANGNKTLYGEYLDALDYAVNHGATHYTAAECFNEQNGAKKEWVINEEKNITMDILYNKYYFEYAGDENNSSVCTMFNYGEHHFMMTGDLEEKGEKALAQYYDGSTAEKTLPHCDLWKAGHHGSKTSSNDVILSKITPDLCCVCCCAGTTEYTKNRVNTFPTQDFINRIAKYTDKVYVTSMWDEEANEFKSMNGNITVSCNGTEISLAASNNLTKLKDTAWFSHDVYVDSSDKIVAASTPGATKVKCRTWPSE